MNQGITSKKPNLLIAYLMIIALMLYVFCYQFAYPFNSTYFLYIAFGCAVLLIVFWQKIHLTNQMLTMALVAAVSAIGTFYTTQAQRGTREAILTVVLWLLLITFAQNYFLLEKVKKAIEICSFFVLIGVLFQYIFKDFANNLLRGLLRSDCYEQLMWSYEVDGAYAGFSAYTQDAGFFCAVVFGFGIFGLLPKKELFWGNKIFRVIVIVLSAFALILTSKRGVVVALLIAFLLTYMIQRRFSIKSIIGVISFILVGIVLLIILGKSNAIIGSFLGRFNSVNSANGDITTGRSEIWRRAIEARSNPLVGLGTGAAYDIYDTGLHNIYLQLFYDHGLIGVLVYLLFFATNLICAIKRKEPIAIYIQFLMLIYGMFGNPIYSTSIFIVYTIFSVIPVGSNKRKELSHQY